MWFCLLCQLLLESLSNLSGFRINNCCPSLTHLFFADNSLVFSIALKDDIGSIIKVLEQFERASGQSINRWKSSFMTSRNVPSEDKALFESLLRINVSDSLGQYLGMPSHVGRNKGLVFRRIKERVEKVLQGWKEKFFSISGKEVLIKAVAQAIPVYTKSCFLLP